MFSAHACGDRRDLLCAALNIDSIVTIIVILTV